VQRKGQPPSQETITRLQAEAKETWRCRAAVARRSRRARADDWRLGCLRGEMQRLSRTMRGREHCLVALQQQLIEGEQLLRELNVEHLRGEEELQREQRTVAGLHKEVLSLREACVVPAQLKRKGASLIAGLDQEGGRMDSERRKRSVEAAAKLHRAVSAQVPALQPFAQRAMVAMQEEFARYQQLERQHARMVQRAQLVVMNGALHASDGASVSARFGEGVASSLVTSGVTMATPGSMGARQRTDSARAHRAY